jgi:hypothetical protein
VYIDSIVMRAFRTFEQASIDFVHPDAATVPESEPLKLPNTQSSKIPRRSATDSDAFSSRGRTGRRPPGHVLRACFVAVVFPCAHPLIVRVRSTMMRRYGCGVRIGVGR